jgi:hypothetical protein
MRFFPPLVALAAVVLLVAACTPENDAASEPAPSPQPVSDSAPYICKLVPEQAFRFVSGTTGSLVEKMSGNESSGDCWAPDVVPRPLEVGWLQVSERTSQEHLDVLMNGRLNIYERHAGVDLPAELGDGMAAHVTNSPLDDQPYRVSAKFRCGGRDRMIDIYLAQVAEGRDGIKDLIELMRIAQKRYGQIYNCTPHA